MDLSDLQGLLAQFQPSEAERASARQQGILAASLGLLGARKGYEFDKIGQAGLLGLNAQQGALQQMIKDRQANLQQAGVLSDMMRKAQFANQLDPNARPQIGPPMGGGLPGGGGLIMNGAPTGGLGGGIISDDASAKLSAQPPAPPAGPMPGMPAPPQQQAPQQQGILAQLRAMGVPDVAIQTAAMSSDPVSAVAALVKEYSQPVFGQGKIPLMRGPGGSFKAVVPEGFNEALAGQTKAETTAQEQAKLPFALQTLNLPSGGTQQLYGDQLQQILRGNGGMPMSGGPAGLAGQSPTPGQLAEQKKRGEDLGAVPAEVASAADNAQNQAARIGEMRKLADLMPFGATAPARVNTAKYLLDVPGIGPQLANTLVKNASVSVPAAQAFGKMASQMVIEQSKQLGTREAASVIQMVANSNPNMSWTRDAAKTAMDYIDGSNKWVEERQQASQQWLASHNGSSDGFQAAWNKEHPLTAYIPPLDRLESAFKTGTVAQSAPQLTPATQSNATAKAMVQQVIQSGDPAKIQRLKELGYIQ